MEFICSTHKTNVRFFSIWAQTDLPQQRAIELSLYLKGAENGNKMGWLKLLAGVKIS